MGPIFNHKLSYNKPVDNTTANPPKQNKALCITTDCTLNVSIQHLHDETIILTLNTYLKRIANETKLTMHNFLIGNDIMLENSVVL